MAGNDENMVQSQNFYTLYERELKLHIAKHSYADYVQLVHAGKWKEAAHLNLVCHELENIIRGDTKRLMLFLPPRHGKSMCVTETFPSFFLGHFPEKRVIELSYGAQLAQMFGKLNRDKFSEFGNDVFGVKLSRQHFAKTNWGIAGTGGGMISVGIGGSVTGHGADLIIIDDPIKNRLEAESKTYRERLWNEYQSTVATRLHAGGSIIIILTRWHFDDLAARLLNPGYGKVEDWKVISLPAVCDDPLSDPLGRKEGETLWPSGGYDENWAAQKKESVGTYVWSALYQQRPAPSAGGLFKRLWWKHWKIMPGDLFDFIQSWDCAFKDSKSSDFVVGQIWARSRSNPANRYLLDQIRGRMSFTETVNAIRQFSGKWPQTQRKLIEDKANGTAVIDVLRKEIPGIVPVEPMGGKVVRAQAVTAAVEAGNVFIPDISAATWVSDFVEELAAFPNGANDDMVDALTQANTYYNDRAEFNIMSLIS